MLDSAWAVILNLLHSVAKGATNAPPPPAGMPPRDREAVGGGETEDTGAAAGDDAAVVAGAGDAERVATWGGACLPLAFKCLQLIVDDFLERISLDQVGCFLADIGT